MNFVRHNQVLHDWPLKMRKQNAQLPGQTNRFTCIHVLFIGALNFISNVPFYFFYFFFRNIFNNKLNMNVITRRCRCHEILRTWSLIIRMDAPEILAYTLYRNNTSFSLNRRLSNCGSVIVTYNIYLLFLLQKIWNKHMASVLLVWRQRMNWTWMRKAIDHEWGKPI